MGINKILKICLIVFFPFIGLGQNNLSDTIQSFTLSDLKEYAV